MSRPVGLHGGAEFEAGDEPFVRALLESTPVSDGRRGRRIVVVPTAGARGRPQLVGAHARDAFERVASELGVAVTVDVALVVDRASADDEGLARLISDADLIHFPGGDPDLIPTLLPGSRVLAAIVDAHARGALLAGASAGAMALAGWTWTAAGGLVGLGFVPGLIVAPHFERLDIDAWRQRTIGVLPVEIGVLGLEERTGVISTPSLAGEGRVIWRVAGAGRAWWFESPGGEPLSAPAGEPLALPAPRLARDEN